MTDSSWNGFRPRFKVCCITSVDEAKLAIRHGADAIGLVSTMPSGPGVIADEEIEEIAATVPPSVSTFLLTSSQDVDEIIHQQHQFGVDTLQLCDVVAAGAIRKLRSKMPGISIVQVVHVVDETSLEQARSAATAAHAVLLDSGNPAKAIRELGGTGRTHDWALSRRIRDALEVPIFLAGGLTPDNVTTAVRQVRPFGVDVCSGLRTDGALDVVKLESFINRFENVGRPLEDWA